MQQSRLFGRGRAVQAVTDVNLSIGQHEAVGRVGESGSGKSTIGRLLLGLVPPSATASLDGVDLVEATRRRCTAPAAHARSSSRTPIPASIRAVRSALNSRTASRSTADAGPAASRAACQELSRKSDCSQGMPIVIRTSSAAASGSASASPARSLRGRISSSRTSPCRRWTSRSRRRSWRCLRTAHATRPRTAVHQPRPAGRAQSLRPGGRALSRPDHGRGAGGEGSREAEPSLHDGRCSRRRRASIHRTGARGSCWRAIRRARPIRPRAAFSARAALMSFRRARKAYRPSKRSNRGTGLPASASMSSLRCHHSRLGSRRRHAPPEDVA